VIQVTVGASIADVVAPSAAFTLATLLNVSALQRGTAHFDRMSNRVLIESIELVGYVRTRNAVPARMILAVNNHTESLNYIIANVSFDPYVIASYAETDPTGLFWNAPPPSFTNLMFRQRQSNHWRFIFDGVIGEGAFASNVGSDSNSQSTYVQDIHESFPVNVIQTFDHSGDAHGGNFILYFVAARESFGTLGVPYDNATNNVTDVELNVVVRFRTL
jgi:hypothetical protein